MENQVGQRDPPGPVPWAPGGPAVADLVPGQDAGDEKADRADGIGPPHVEPVWAHVVNERRRGADAEARPSSSARHEASTLRRQPASAAARSFARLNSGPDLRDTGPEYELVGRFAVDSQSDRSMCVMPKEMPMAPPGRAWVVPLRRTHPNLGSSAGQ